jgi:hypothetical protein
MLPDQSAPATGVTLPCSELSDERRLALEQRCSAYYHQLAIHGVDNKLAHSAAEILAYVPLPWAPRDQAIVRRAWEQLIKGMEDKADA